MDRSKLLRRSAVLCGGTSSTARRPGRLLLSSSSSSSSPPTTTTAKRLRGNEERRGLPVAKKSLRVLLVEAPSASAVRSLFASRGIEFTASNLSTAAHRLAKYGAKSDEPFIQALRRSLASDDWRSRESSQLAWALAKMGVVDDALYSSLAAVTDVDSLKPQGLANVTWAYAVVGRLSEEAGLAEALKHATRLKIGEFKAVDHAMVAWAWSKARDPELLPLVASEVNVGDCEPRELSNLAWAMTSAGSAEVMHSATALLTAIQDAVPLHTFKPQELANLASAFARHGGHQWAPLFAALKPALIASSKRLKSQELASAAWAYSRANAAEAPELLQAFLGEIDDRIFKPQEIANLSWSFARAGLPIKGALRNAALSGNSRLGSGLWKPQELASLAWALAQSDLDEELFGELSAAADLAAFSDPRELAPLLRASAKSREHVFFFRRIALRILEVLPTWGPHAIGSVSCSLAKGPPRLSVVEEGAMFEALSGAAQRQMASFSPRALANTSWAFATTAHGDARLFAAIAAASQDRLGEFKPQELANLAWAFTTVGVYDEALYEAMAREAPLRIAELNPQELSLLLWAFSKSNRPADDLYDKAAHQVTRNIDSYDPQELTLVSWSFAVTGKADPRLFEALAEAAVPLLAAFSEQNRANLAWAFLKAGIQHEKLFGDIFRVLKPYKMTDPVAACDGDDDSREAPPASRRRPKQTIL